MSFKIQSFIFSLLILASCNSSTPPTDNNISNFNETEKSAAELKRDLKDIEFESPVDYLNTSGTYRQTLFGNKFKVDMKIENTASIASYKDVVIHFAYYSKTGTEITSFDHTIYEVFPPGSTKTISLKIDNYNDVEKVNWSILNATPYK